MSARVFGWPFRPRLEAPCPAWCVEHVEDEVPRIGSCPPIPCIDHRGPLPFMVDGFKAWLSLEVTVNDETGEPESEGPMLWIYDDTNGTIVVPASALSTLGLLADLACAVLGDDEAV